MIISIGITTRLINFSDTNRFVQPLYLQNTQQPYNHYHSTTQSPYNHKFHYYHNNHIHHYYLNHNNHNLNNSTSISHNHITQTINQPILKFSTNQSIKKPINQTYPTINQLTIKQFPAQTTNQSIKQSIKPTTT